MITEVALTPLRSKAEAEAAIARTKVSLGRRRVDGHALDESDTEDEEGEFSAAALSDEVDDEHIERLRRDEALSMAQHKRTSSVAEDVMAKRGSYGRFAQKWFSRKGWYVFEWIPISVVVGGEVALGTKACLKIY